MPHPTTVILVEGESDRAAVGALARMRGRDLGVEGVEVRAMGGATNISRHLEVLASMDGRVRLAGLYDAAEERWFRRGLERAGRGPAATRAELEALGFFCCEADLEEELIRALGTDAVLDVVSREGELESFRVLQQQPAQRGRRLEDQLRRFIGTASGRKIRYGRLLVEALPPGGVPRPLELLLSRV